MSIFTFTLSERRRKGDSAKGTALVGFTHSFTFERWRTGRLLIRLPKVRQQNQILGELCASILDELAARLVLGFWPKQVARYV
jgi:hypothetical protein